MSCSICLENYNNQTCLPLMLSPCGHGVCETCLTSWNKIPHLANHTCPECRQVINNSTRNRALLDMLEQSSLALVNDNENNNKNNKDNKNNKKERELSNLATPLFSNNDSSKITDQVIKRPNEIMNDKCGSSFVVIDNSGSMNIEDGKQFYQNKHGEIIKYQYTSRWKEAENKILEISNYNINRGIVTSYYLLNPIKSNNWLEDVDYVVINPSSSNYLDKLAILKKTILADTNIRGSTPLDKITIKFGEFLQTLPSNNQTVSYNLVTDGEPNNKTAFEAELRNLALHNSVFIVVNLCSDSESVIDYYNDLDVKIGNELSGLDVIDDFEAEQLEVVAKNDFFVYGFMIHVARMAGCYSVVADMMDEEALPLPYIHKLVKELLGQKDMTLNISEIDSYLSSVARENRLNRVYNYLTKKMETPINMIKLRKLISEKNKNYKNNKNNKCIIG